MQSDPYETISALGDAQSRIVFLRALTKGPARKAELEARTELSRSTINRRADEMEKSQWASTNPMKQYHLTLIGELLIRYYDTFEANLTQLAAKSEFFDQLQNHNIDIPLDVLENSTVIAATDGDPHAVVNNFIESTRLKIDTFRGIVPITSPVFNEHAGHILEQGADMELIIDATVLEDSKAKYPDHVERGLAAENFTFLIHQDKLDFGLAIFGGECALFCAYNDKGQLTAGLTGQNQTFIDWVEQMYEFYRTDSHPIP